MKLFAHRGWCAGADENTLAAFARAAGQAGISGIELDVRRAPDGNTLLVCHDPPRPGETTLTLDAALEFLSGTNLELFIELKEHDIAPMVIDKLVATKMAECSVVFAFAPVARAMSGTLRCPISITRAASLVKLTRWVAAQNGPPRRRAQRPRRRAQRRRGAA